MQPKRTSGLLAAAVLLSASFGVADRIVQGHSSAGWYLANVAGVWLAVAFVFGALASRREEAGLVGLCAELAALVGYYGYKHFVQHEHEPESHLVLWFCSGFVAAPLFGVMGFQWRRRRSQMAGVLLGVVFVAEALLLGFTRNRPPRIAAAEIVGGIVLAAMLLAAARWRDHHDPRHRVPRR